MIEPMIRTNVHFPAALLARLRKISKQSGVPVAEIIRRAVMAYLSKTGE
jgi:hypothetical protein